MSASTPVCSSPNPASPHGRCRPRRPCAAVVGALVAGVPMVPINPKAGERELAHIVADSSPALLLTAKGTELPPQLAGVPRVDVDLSARGDTLPAKPSPETRR